ncbi:acetyltransferase [Microbacterium aerolatum]|uniref:Pilus assembly protein n=1 Tax=Microbacterium aerolatum TaxID=153731 RepID=A0A511AA98_9MICO|nr:acetyltransferase [Microbacterium aerolatum]GEK84936.1 pilus assembly protein [Microbacterium aerolatum]GGB37343.1 pilus assembly protein [Microbacterium aerolatum]
MTELVLLGGGGHARSLLAALTLQGRGVQGYLAPRSGDLSRDCPYLGDDDVLMQLNPREVQIVNGLGSTASTKARSALYDRVTTLGFSAARVIHPRAFVDPSAALGAGVQVFAGAIVNAGAAIGDDAIVNSGAVVEHDVVVGAHSHIAPGAVLAGAVHLGEGVHVGLGARVIQSVSVAARGVIGAGAVVIDDVPADVTVVGVPARQIRSRREGRR